MPPNAETLLRMAESTGRNMSSHGMLIQSLFLDPTLVTVLLKLGGRKRDDGTYVIDKNHIFAELHRAGILENDPRVKEFCDYVHRHQDHQLGYDAFREAVLYNSTFIKRIADRELVIADFSSFTEKLSYLIESVRPNDSGQCAQYIPSLRNANPERLGMAFCSIDGQFFETGDSRNPFSIQSCSKFTMLAIALEKFGMEGVGKWVGVAPSGQAFNHASLLPDGRPFNPMINAGAIMTSAVVASAYPHLCEADAPKGSTGERAENLLKEVLHPVWSKLAGEGIVGDIGFLEETFRGERSTADTNYSLAYLMRGKTGLPEPVSLETMLDFYFRSCSIKATAATMSVVAATLANGGQCPMTGRQVFSSETVRQVLSSMVLSGMYDAAGDFYVKIGAPAKSGVSGCVMVVIPSVGGYCVFSPRLDEYGNSVRGVAFAEALHSTFRFHAFDTVGSWVTKEDPRFSSNKKHLREIQDMRWALSIGDKQAATFAHLLKLTAVYVGWSDGKFTPGDYRILTNAYFQVTKTVVSDAEIDALAKEVGACIEVNDEGFGASLDCLEGLLDLLREKASMLDDLQKELILEVALLVAYPEDDHRSKPVEHMIIHDICESLGVPTDILPMKTYDLRRNKGRRFSFINIANDIQE